MPGNAASSAPRDTIETILNRFLPDWNRARERRDRMVRALQNLTSEDANPLSFQQRTLGVRNRAMGAIFTSALAACSNAGYGRNQVEPIWNRLTAEAMASHEGRFVPRRRGSEDTATEVVRIGEGGPVHDAELTRRSPEGYGDPASVPSSPVRSNPTIPSNVGRQQRRGAEGASGSVRPHFARNLDLTLPHSSDEEGESS